MTREQLTKYIDNIDDKIIEEAASYKIENKNNSWIAKAALIAACVCIVIGVCIVANINSNQVIAEQNVIDGGEYYTIYELYRDFGNEQGKKLSKQYQFVVYNGRCVLYSGISVNEKPDIRQISENIIRVEYKTNGAKTVTYCDLGMTTGECTKTVTDEILLEWDERYACLYYEYGIPSVAICNMESDYWGDYWIDSIILEKGVSDVEVSINKKHNKITISYVNQNGEYKTEKRKISNQVIEERLPIENETEVQCHWENKLIKETDDYYIYDVSLVINRRDGNKHTKQYQYFVKHNGKVIDGGYSKGIEPAFENVDEETKKVEYVVDDNYLGMEDIVFSKYYNLNNGKVSKPYESVLYEWKDRVAYLKEQRNAHQFLEICDMFSGDLMQMEAFDDYVYEVKRFELNAETTELTVYYMAYLDDDSEKEVKQTIKLSNEKMSEEEINNNELLIRDDDIARVYDITEKQSLAQYRYYILDNDGEVVESDISKMHEPYIEKVSDNIVSVRRSYGTGAWGCTYYNREKVNGMYQVSAEFHGALTEFGKRVVYPSYENNNTYITISDMFGENPEVETYLLLENDSCSPGSISARIKANKLIVEYVDGNGNPKKKEIQIEK